MLLVTISLVDGSGLEEDVDETILIEYQELVRQGYEGKHLIDKLWTDDWGAPPRWMKISGVTSSGEVVEIRINYV